jgi:hypothetical protein
MTQKEGIDTLLACRADDGVDGLVGALLQRVGQAHELDHLAD